MPTYYLLRCTGCDHQFQLTATQAGQALPCPKCDTRLEVPKLGVLKQLQTDDGSQLGPTSPSSVASGWKRYMFAMGLVVGVVAGIAGIALYLYSQSLFTPVDMESHIARVEQEIDQYSPAQLWDLWYAQDLEGGLGEWAEPNYVRYNKQSAILKNIAYGILGVAGLGLVTMLSSFAMRR